jgi:hypothetical protein
MPPRRPTSSGKLSDLARHVILPSGIVSTGWPAVRDKCREVGIVFDEWQDGLGRAILAKRADGQYAAGIGGVVMSIARQVGKTFTVGSMIVALCILFPGLKVVWTAHRGRTSDETFKSLQGMVKRKKIAPHISIVRTANGQQEISFVNGSRILFGARESGFGRGFDDVDILVFDEAQILSAKALEDMVPSTNVAANPLVFLMGTPPKPTDPSEAFTHLRSGALSGELDDVLFVEFSADENANVEDRAQWRKGNPSYPHRTPESAMLRMKRILGDDSFRREGMGIWDKANTTTALIKPREWSDLLVHEAPPGAVAYGVKFSADGSRVSLAVAVRPDDDSPVHVEVVRSASMAAGDGWLVDWLVARLPGSLGVAIDGKSGSGPLINELRKRRVAPRLIISPSIDQVISAHSMVLGSAQAGALSHFGQSGLDDAVKGATKRPIGKREAGGWGWQPIGDSVDVTPLEAVTFAHFVAATTRRKASTDKGRKVVVLS